MTATPEPVTFQGQFGPFTITDHDRREVQTYRAALAVAALSFATATGFALSPAPALAPITALYGLFCAALGVALWTVHIYLAPLHRALQIGWGLGCAASLTLALGRPDPLPQTVYQAPWALFAVGWVFVALTGLYFKEAFCFGRFETKLLTPLVPLLLGGHWIGLLPLGLERGLLALWALLFAVFALRKLRQPIPDDIGDKSVFAYLRQPRPKAVS